MEDYDREYAQEVGKRIAAMTQAELHAYANRVATQAVDSYKQKVASATPEQIIAMLNQIIIDAPGPEQWTEQQQKDLSTIEFTLSWLHAQQSKSEEWDLHKFSVGDRVRIIQGGLKGEFGTIYNYLPSRPAPWHVRPDSYKQDEPGIAYKSSEIELAPEQQVEEDVSEDEHTFRQICGWEDAPQQSKETQP